MIKKSLKACLKVLKGSAERIWPLKIKEKVDPSAVDKVSFKCLLPLTFERAHCQAKKQHGGVKENKKKAKTKCDKQIGVTQFSSVTSYKLMNDLFSEQAVLSC